MGFERSILEKIEQLNDDAKQKSEAGRHADAAALFREIVDRLPPGSELTPFYLRAADEHLSAGEFREAIDDCHSAIAFAPNSAIAWRTLGRALIHSQDETEAEQALLKSIDLSPSRSAYVYLAAVYRFEDRLKESENCCHEALMLDPDFDEAYFNLGLVMRRQGRPEDALMSFKKAVRLSPGYALAHLEIGELLLEKSDYCGAASHLRKSLESSPNNARTIELLKRALKEE